MARYDAQLHNDSDRNVRQYSDLDLFFSRKTSNGDVNKITDIQAVKRYIRNLVQLNTYDKPFHPEISGGVLEMLFENMSPITGHVIARKVELVIENFEPRARLVSVSCSPDYNRNAYEVTVEFYIVNAPTELVDLTVMLERLR